MYAPSQQITKRNEKRPEIGRPCLSAENHQHQFLRPQVLPRSRDPSRSRGSHARREVVSSPEGKPPPISRCPPMLHLLHSPRPLFVRLQLQLGFASCSSPRFRTEPSPIRIALQSIRVGLYHLQATIAHGQENRRAMNGLSQLHVPGLDSSFSSRRPG